jgi:hypothetical protein
MAKVLKITKADKTVHVVPMVNKAFYQAYNNRQPVSKKWKVEEIDEEDAKNLPFIDESHTSPLEAVQKVSKLQASLADKDAEIEALKAQLASKSGASPDADDSTGTAETPTQTATDKIALINAATTVEQVQALLEGEQRSTVLKAGAKKVSTLTAE